MYKPINLKYDYNALEPYIDTETIFIHYNRHYKNYLDKLNNLLLSINYDFSDSIVDIVKNIDKFPLNIRGDILFNAGGVINHELYFLNISPLKNNEPVGKLKDKINKKYGSFDNFKKEFKKQSSLLVGSGYTFLVINSKKDLEIINTSNQESPYLYGLIPIMTIDLWEHAYYLKYKNHRDLYIDNFFSIVDFNEINKLYEQNI